MIKSVKFLIFLMVCLFASGSISCMLPTVPQPGAVRYELKPVSSAESPTMKCLATNNPNVEAFIIDCSCSMTASQRELFDTYGLIPMLVTVENKSDDVIHIAKDVLSFGVGLSVDSVKDAIVRSFKLKKYGTYAAIVAYDTLIGVGVLAVALSMPYMLSISKTLLFGIGSSIGYLIINLPAWMTLGAAVGSTYLTLNYLPPQKVADLFHGLVNKYYGIKEAGKAPFVNIKELDQAIDFVAASSNTIDFDVNSKSRKQFMIFVKSADATAIKKGTACPVLKFEGPNKPATGSTSSSTSQ